MTSGLISHPNERKEIPVVMYSPFGLLWKLWKYCSLSLVFRGLLTQISKAGRVDTVLTMKQIKRLGIPRVLPIYVKKDENKIMYGRGNGTSKPGTWI